MLLHVYPYDTIISFFVIEKITFYLFCQNIASGSSTTLQLFVHTESYKVIYDL